MTGASPPPRPGGRLVVDASNVSAGGARTHLQALLARAELAPFSEIVVIGGAGVEAVFGVAHPKVRYVADPELPPLRWHGSAMRDLPGYVHQVVKVLNWRQRRLPRHLSALGATVVFGANGVLPAHTPPGVRRVVASRNMLPFEREEASRYGWGVQRLRLAWLRRQQARSFRSADAVLFLSRHAREVIADGLRLELKASRSTVIYNGVDPAVYHPPADLASRLQRAPRDVLYVSSLDRYKHHVEVVRAFASLCRRTDGDLRLHFAGWEHARTAARVRRTIADLGLHDRVTLHGVLPPQELAALYRQADLFVFASTCENCPTIMIEAMACGLPMACTAKPPMTEIAAAAAVTFDAGSPEDIAAAVARLVGDRALRHRLSRAALARAAEFSWDDTARRTFAFLAG